MPDPDDDDCSALSKAIDRVTLARGLYIRWDAKWSPGRHAQKIAETENRLGRLKNRYTKNCTQK